MLYLNESFSRQGDLFLHAISTTHGEHGGRGVDSERAFCVGGGGKIESRDLQLFFFFNLTFFPNLEFQKSDHKVWEGGEDTMYPGIQAY